jgi:hypothetical protein
VVQGSRVFASEPRRLKPVAQFRPVFSLPSSGRSGKGEDVMRRLEGSVAVVAGGTGRVGEGLVRSFLMEGAQVVVPVRTKERE